MEIIEDGKQALAGVLKAAGGTGSATNGHTYVYHPPAAGHPLVSAAPQALRLEAPALPSRVDLRNYCKPVRDQGHEGACSGFATAAFREASHAVAAGAVLPDYLSPAYLYALTRLHDFTFPKDSGASIADEFFILQTLGVCLEATLPFTGDATEKPDVTQVVAGLRNRISQALKVGRDAVSLKSVLAAKQTVAIGFTVYPSFERTGADGKVPMANASTETALGGHGVLVCGYDDANQCWLVRNQWGTAWGAGGYCFMPYGYEQFWTEAWTAVPSACATI